MSDNPVVATIDKEPGNYILVLYNDEEQEVEVGKLATLDLQPGYYLYVGSALGPGGVQARVNRHSQKNKKNHWHIDYLRAVTNLVSIWYVYSEERYEHHFAELLETDDNMSVPLLGFGASDCNCQAHLFYSRQKPNFSYYQQQLENISLLQLSDN